jgi:hypothetical protein
VEQEKVSISNWNIYFFLYSWDRASLDIKVVYMTQQDATSECLHPGTLDPAGYH